MKRQLRSLSLYVMSASLAGMFILCTGLAASAASMTVMPSGDGVFIVYGKEMDKVAGLDLSIRYDPSVLTSPTVTLGGLVSGSLMTANTGTAGTVKAAIISADALADQGEILRISFATHKRPGGVTSLTADLIDRAGEPVEARVEIIDENGETAAPDPPATITAPPAPAASVIPKAPSTTTADVSLPPSTPPAIQAPATIPQDKEVTVISHNGVIERFRSYKGEKSPAILIALFKKVIVPGISQIPAVVLSDGATRATILVELPELAGKSPSFALNNAALLSIKMEGASKWLIEALPRSQALDAELLIMSEGRIVEFPLTIAPPITGMDQTEAAFAGYLLDIPGRLDFNGDGISNADDDFIYTANYLALQEKEKIVATTPAEGTRLPAYEPVKQ